MPTKTPSQAEINAAILERLERLDQRIEQGSDKPSLLENVRNWLAAHWLALLVGAAVGFVAVKGLPSSGLPGITKPAIERKAASEVADIPFPERKSVADALRSAAARVATDPSDRYAADEAVRRTVAMQPSKDKWSRAFASLSASVFSTDTLT